MTTKLIRMVVCPDTPDETVLAYIFECPACGLRHKFDIEGTVRPTWVFNGNLERPTFTPSLRSRSGSGGPTDDVCHFNLTDGILHFCSDCTHAYAGKSLPLPDIKE